MTILINPIRAKDSNNTHTILSRNPQLLNNFDWHLIIKPSFNYHLMTVLITPIRAEDSNTHTSLSTLNYYIVTIGIESYQQPSFNYC